MNSKAENSDPSYHVRTWLKSGRVRRNAVWVAIVASGVLQFVYAKIKHPATPLVILETLYGLVVIVAVVWFIADMLVARRK
jgi:uncharacterized membrane protein HdeD (DUF308 family)